MELQQLRLDAALARNDKAYIVNLELNLEACLPFVDSYSVHIIPLS